MERCLGRAPRRAEQPLGPAAQEIHGPRTATDAKALGGPPWPRQSHSAAPGRSPTSHTTTSRVGGGNTGSSGHLPAGRAGPGRRDAARRRHPSAEGAQGGGGKRRASRDRERREERGGPPRPLPPRAARASPRRAAWVGGESGRARWRLHPSPLWFLKLRLKLPRRLRTASSRRRFGSALVTSYLQSGACSRGPGSEGGRAA
jgi:hypothetical protein